MDRWDRDAVELHLPVRLPADDGVLERPADRLVGSVTGAVRVRGGDPLGLGLPRVGAGLRVHPGTGHPGVEHVPLDARLGRPADRVRHPAVPGGGRNGRRPAGRLRLGPEPEQSQVVLAEPVLPLRHVQRGRLRPDLRQRDGPAALPGPDRPPGPGSRVRAAAGRRWHPDPGLLAGGRAPRVPRPGEPERRDGRERPDLAADPGGLGEPHHHPPVLQPGGHRLRHQRRRQSDHRQRAGLRRRVELAAGAVLPVRDRRPTPTSRTRTTRPARTSCPRRTGHRGCPCSAIRSTPAR